jgi:serine phosphatase RsbU (regulator of sigma subunit)
MSDPGVIVTTAGGDQPKPGVETITVLLVEDDEGDAFLVQDLLADTPAVAIVRAWSLAEAHVRLPGVDCVLLDLGLPDTFGLDGVRRLRAAAGRTPIVVLTGHTDETQGVAALAAGAQDYLIKGQVTSHQLTRTIYYAIQRRHVEDIESALLEERIHADENTRLERGLLPQPVLWTPDVSITTRYRPGGGRMLLGGDFFDVVQGLDGTVHAVIGDVAGHGPDQAALGVALRIAWRTLVLAHHPADEILTVLDRVLVHERHDAELFATVCTATISADHRSADVYCAGHPAPLVAGSTGGWHAAAVGSGPALGLIDGSRWRPSRLELPPTHRFLLYTDGAIEGRVGDGDDRLGIDGLRSVCDTAGIGAGDVKLLDHILTEVTRLNGGRLTDDLALLLLSTVEGRS